MKYTKRFLRMLALVMAFAILSPTIIPISNLAVAQAATVKLNKKTLSLEVGKSQTLKITGTTAKVTWSSSNKSVATVSTKGKVTAKKAGKATITATVSKKKYSCTVTVKKAVNQSVKNAPFSAQEATLGHIRYVYPKDWTNKVVMEEDSQAMSLLYPSNVNIFNGTSITIITSETDMTKPTLSDVQEFIESTYTQEALAEQYGLPLDSSISNLKANEFKAKQGIAFKVDFDTTVTAGVSITMNQCIYALFLDKYMFLVSTSDNGDGEELKLTEIAEYMVNTATLVK